MEIVRKGKEFGEKKSDFLIFWPLFWPLFPQRAND
jgi:hypothetical protein